MSLNDGVWVGINSNAQPAQRLRNGGNSFHHLAFDAQNEGLFTQISAPMCLG